MTLENITDLTLRWGQRKNQSSGRHLLAPASLVACAASLILCNSIAMGGDGERPEISANIGAKNLSRMKVTFAPIAPKQGDARAIESQGNCPQIVSSHTDASFTGGQYVLQQGFAENEIAAAVYTVPAGEFPIQLDLAEMIFAQSTNTATTTEWSFLVWEGTPNNGTLIFSVSSDGKILPHIVMPPGTQGVNVQVSVDPGDPEQIVIQDNGTHQFTIGYRIDEHNNQTGSGCNFGDIPANQNAFPTTDSSGVDVPAGNWLYAINCGPLGCPSGWNPFSALGFCQPRGDWVMRATWHSLNCSGVVGACCLPAGTCTLLTASNCLSQGGEYQGDSVACSSVKCESEFGACCIGADCFELVSASDCAFEGGTFLGAGSDCAGVNCGDPLGACCVPATGGCLDLNASDCAVIGGVWQIGASCGSTICFPMGACCLPDGMCADNGGAGMAPEDCDALGGTFQGDGSNCTSANCPQPTGACCIPATGGCLVLTQTFCATAGGNWAGMATNCADGNGNGTADACEINDCVGDIDEDGEVDFDDFTILLASWGPCPGCAADLDDNDEVDFDDFTLLLAAWGDCP